MLRRILFLPERGSTLAGEVDHLHYAVIGVTMAGAFGVALLTLWFIVRYERGGDRAVKTARVKIPLWFELTLLFGLLSLFLFWFWRGFGIYQRITTPPEGATTVYTVGKQWMWQFDYPSGPASVGRLYVPAGRPVRLLLTSRDVIHSLFVPAFRVKQDAVPGRYTECWFEAPLPGTFDIFCAEYCGTSHSTMRAEAVVLSAEDYERWLAGREPAGIAAGERSLAEIGRIVAAEKECLRCHTIDGTKHIGPTWRDLFGRRETMRDGTQVLVDEAYITESMMDPLAKIVAGFDPVMPSYRGRIEPGETAAIIEYMKSLSRDASRREGR
jgi:cytochrome c oxidase subunit 2